eukprot:jgi/Chrzof1/12037/Cz06g19010.t1
MLSACYAPQVNVPCLRQFQVAARPGSAKCKLHTTASAQHHALPVPLLTHNFCARRVQRDLRVAGSAKADTQTEAKIATQSATITAATASPWLWEESDDALQAYGAFFGLLGIGQLQFLYSQKWADLPYFIGLAVMTIYIGAHRGLTTKQRQQITIKEGVLAPVFASISLFSVYLIIKFLPNLDLQLLLNAYFWLLGTFAIAGASIPLLRRATGPLGRKSIQFSVPDGWVLDDKGTSVNEVKLAPSDLAAAALAVGLASAELAGHHTNFTLNNLIACLVATDILQLLGIRSFRTAALMLFGLLAYDVFWVFGSPAVVGDNVMLAVATSDAITGPTRLLFPRIPGGMGEAAEFPFSLLGLGDIAIPGLLACLALRYDASRSTDMRARAVAAADAISSALAQLEPGASGTEMANAAAQAAEAAYDKVADRELRQRNNTLNGHQASSNSTSSSSRDGDSHGSSSEPDVATHEGQEERMPVSDAVLQQRAYFTPVVWSYIGGLLMAFAANNITNLGQPALLYIVPCTLTAVAWTAVSRGELQRIWQFTDVPTFGLPEKEKPKN